MQLVDRNPAHEVLLGEVEAGVWSLNPQCSSRFACSSPADAGGAARWPQPFPNGALPPGSRSSCLRLHRLGETARAFAPRFGVSRNS